MKIFTKSCFLFSVNLVLFTSGISLTWTSSIDHKLTTEDYIDENPFGRLLSDEEISWIGSLISIGAMVGPFAAAYFSDKIGRKYTLLLFSGLPMLMCYTIAALAQDVFIYYISRFLSGVAVGTIYTVVPNYISEISEVNNRGAMSSTINIFECAGMIFSYAVGPYVSILWYNIACAIVPAVFIVLFLCFIPESPYFLIAANKQEKALASLRKFRSNTPDQVDKEMDEIKADVKEAMERNASLSEIFKSTANRKALIISLTLIGIQMFTGINVILFYTQEIFETTGSSIPSELASIVIGLVQLFASFVTPTFVERLGRKSLLLFSAFGVILSQVPLGIYFHLKDYAFDVEDLYWMPLICLIAYIITYTVGFGPLPWTVMSEIFPPDVKSRAAMATTFFCWLLSFFLTKFFHRIYNVIGMGGSFWLFSGITLFGILFVHLYVVETKGKKFSEIQDLLAGNTPPSVTRL